MTIEIHSGTLPLASSYTSSVNITPPRHAFIAAYTRYLRLRADAFDADCSKTDAEMYALLGAEARALADAALAPAHTVEEYGLKLQLLQSQLAEIDVDHPVALLAAGLAADLRHL